MSKEKQIGILAPQLPWRFRLRVTGTWLSKDEHAIITTQTESVGIDYLNKQLTVTLVQNANNTLLHEAIGSLMDKNVVVLHIDSVNTNGDVDPEYILEFDCKIKSHDFKFDYCETKVAAKHKLVFGFNRMLPYNRKEEEEELNEVA